jgi:hypothetical protein
MALRIWPLLRGVDPDANTGPEPGPGPEPGVDLDPDTADAGPEAAVAP